MFNFVLHAFLNVLYSMVQAVEKDCLCIWYTQENLKKKININMQIN